MVIETTKPYYRSRDDESQEHLLTTGSLTKSGITLSASSLIQQTSPVTTNANTCNTNSYDEVATISDIVSESEQLPNRVDESQTHSQTQVENQPTELSEEDERILDAELINVDSSNPLVSASKVQADDKKSEAVATTTSVTDQELVDGSNSVLDAVLCNAFQAGSYDFGPGMRMLLQSMRRITAFPNAITTVASREEFSTCNSVLGDNDGEQKQLKDDIGLSMSDLSGTIMVATKEIACLIDKIYPTDNEAPAEDEHRMAMPTGVFDSTVQGEIAALNALRHGQQPTEDDQTISINKLDGVVITEINNVVVEAGTFAGQSFVADNYEMTLSKLTQSCSVTIAPSYADIGAYDTFTTNLDIGDIGALEVVEENSLLQQSKDVLDQATQPDSVVNKPVQEATTSFSFDSQAESRIRYPPILIKRMSMNSNVSKFQGFAPQSSFHDNSLLLKNTFGEPHSPVSMPGNHKLSKLMQPRAPDQDVVIVSRSTLCSEDTSMTGSVGDCTTNNTGSFQERTTGIIETIDRENQDVVTKSSINDSLDQSWTGSVIAGTDCSGNDTVTDLPTASDFDIVDQAVVKSPSSRSLLSRAGSLLLGSRSEHGAIRKSFGFPRSPSSLSYGSAKSPTIPKRDSQLSSNSEHGRPTIKANNSFLSLPTKPSTFANVSRGTATKTYERFDPVHEPKNHVNQSADDKSFQSEMSGVTSVLPGSLLQEGSLTRANVTPDEETPYIPMEQDPSFFLSHSQSIISDVSMNPSIVSKRSIASSLQSNSQLKSSTSTASPGRVSSFRSGESTKSNM